jgi:hypothetical protein
MTTIVVPLAGPDAYSHDGRIRALQIYEGAPIFESVLKKRNWVRDLQPTDQLIFVIRKESNFHELLSKEIMRIFPSAEIIVLDHSTNGALLTCLIGALSTNNPDEVVILDLADIDFRTDFNPKEIFNEKGVDGAIPYFNSNSKVYSFLELDTNDYYVLKTREKQVLSNNASAGVYLFRNMRILLEAASWGFRHTEISSINGKYFVCPIYNGMIIGGSKIRALNVADVVSHSEVFHNYD